MTDTATFRTTQIGIGTLVLALLMLRVILWPLANANYDMLTAYLPWQAALIEYGRPPPDQNCEMGPHGRDRVSLTTRPACPLPGTYSFVTNRDSLRRILRRTDLPSTVLEKFETGIYRLKGGNLTAVELCETTQIGNFID
jgi:hypothetical protein